LAQARGEPQRAVLERKKISLTPIPRTWFFFFYSAARPAFARRFFFLVSAGARNEGKGHGAVRFGFFQAWQRGLDCGGLTRVLLKFFFSFAFGFYPGAVSPALFFPVKKGEYTRELRDTKGVSKHAFLIPGVGGVTNGEGCECPICAGVFLRLYIREFHRDRGPSRWSGFCRVFTGV